LSENFTDSLRAWNLNLFPKLIDYIASNIIDNDDYTDLCLQILSEGDASLNGTHSAALEEIINFYEMCVQDDQTNSTAVEKVVKVYQHRVSGLE
jgi:hypothetical protein